MGEKRRKEVKAGVSFPRCLAILSKTCATTTPVMWQARSMVVQPRLLPSHPGPSTDSEQERRARQVPASQPGE